MGNSEEKRLPDKGLSDFNFSSFVLTLKNFIPLISKSGSVINYSNRHGC
jgi:hypothetical protein